MQSGDCLDQDHWGRAEGKQSKALRVCRDMKNRTYILWVFFTYCNMAQIWTSNTSSIIFISWQGAGLQKPLSVCQLQWYFSVSTSNGSWVLITQKLLNSHRFLEMVKILFSLKCIFSLAKYGNYQIFFSTFQWKDKLKKQQLFIFCSFHFKNDTF